MFNLKFKKITSVYNNLLRAYYRYYTLITIRMEWDTYRIVPLFTKRWPLVTSPITVNYGKDWSMAELS